jgi:hypothetical protein
MSALQQTIERRRAADESAASPFYATKDRATSLRVETSGGEVWLLPWHHFVFGRHEARQHERLVLTFVAHEVAVQGLNLAALVTEVANQRIEWLRAAPGKYLRAAGGEPSIDQICVRPLTESEGGLK